MKKPGHIYTLTLILAAAVCGCSLEEPLHVGGPSSDALMVVGRPTPFNTINVDTKATKNNDESVIVNMAMFVFDASGARVDYQFIEESKPLFIIDRDSETYSEYANQALLADASIYILANIPSADRSTLALVGSESALLDFDFSVSAVIRSTQVNSYGGLPMFGRMPDAVDLRKPSSTADDPLKGSVLEIPMTCLFAKVTMNFLVSPTQKSDYVQKFRMTDWTVENVPSKVRMRQPVGDSQYHDQSASAMLSGTFSSIDKGTNPVLEGGSTPLSFSFYVPEHRLTPARTSMTYPSGIDDEHRQMFKPEWLSDGEYPVKVTINGVYTDHRNIGKKVSYTLYPGLDNWKSFYVNRDCEYINDITILGISNSKYGDAGSISLDTRVDVHQNQFKFEIERETLLDSHWEIRPIRITLDPGQYPGSRIEVAVVDANGLSAAEGGSIPSWIRMEMPGGYASIQGDPAYCDVSAQTDLACGKRRYFTSNLVTGTLAGSSSAAFTAEAASNSGSANSHEHTIWVYVDENVSGTPAAGSSTRQAAVRCRFFIDGGTTVPTVEEYYYFIQKSLHRINSSSRSYGIEYYEEYLYNFDAKEQFGTTTDGIEWGLESVQLSNKYKSANYSASGLIGGIIAYIINEAIQKVAMKYDFYLTRDGVKDGLTIRDYSGYDFTKEIASNPNSGISTLSTDAQPQSAVEYCVNKNKRNSDGTIDYDNMTWYLPAIDEIEDICIGGYSEFEVFQDKYYWSSQPAYRIGKMDYVAKVTSDEVVFNYYTDDIGLQEDPDNRIGRARATKINDSFENVKSESHGEAGLLMAAGRGEDISDGPDYYPCYNGHNVSQNKKYSECGLFGLSSYTTTQATITWSASTHYYDEGNQPRDAVNRVRCVYKAH